MATPPGGQGTGVTILEVIPVAHAGHWLVQVVYFLPVVAFLVWLAITQIRARRSGDGDDPGKSPGVR